LAEPGVELWSLGYQARPSSRRDSREDCRLAPVETCWQSTAAIRIEREQFLEHVLLLTFIISQSEKQTNNNNNNSRAPAIVLFISLIALQTFAELRHALASELARQTIRMENGRRPYREWQLVMCATH
jgi:hypothetical protein